jgi:hypothetical protein
MCQPKKHRNKMEYKHQCLINVNRMIRIRIKCTENQAFLYTVFFYLVFKFLTPFRVHKLISKSMFKYTS